MPAVTGKESTEMNAEIRGSRICLRFVTPDDAAYIHGLRMNPAYNAYLSAVNGSVDDQRGWIEAYKAREAAGLEFYYIIERHDGTPCGSVRLYDINNDSFTWGSWILDRNKPKKAALESALLSFGVGFDSLNKEKALIDVRYLNTHAAAFYRRFGAVETGQDDRNIYFELSRAVYAANHSTFHSAIEAA